MRLNPMRKGYDWRVYMAYASQITPFAQVVQSIIPDCISYMNKKVKRIQENNVALINELWEIERELSVGKMGIQEQTQTSTEIYHPIFSVSTTIKGVPMFDQPIPDVKGFQIPFA